MPGPKVTESPTGGYAEDKENKENVYPIPVPSPRGGYAEDKENKENVYPVNVPASPPPAEG